MTREKRTRPRDAESLARLRAWQEARVVRVKEGVDLHTLAQDLGGVPSREGRQGGEVRYLFGPEGARTHRVRVVGNLWQCPHHGGGDAISLCMSIRGGTFQDTVKYLHDTYLGSDRAAPRPRPAAARQEEMRPVERALEIPRPDPSIWPQTRRHLVEGRGIAPDIVDAAHARGDLYGAAWESKSGRQIPIAVMIARGAEGHIAGAEIKSLAKVADGKRMSILAAGSRKSEGAFCVGCPIERAQAVGVVEGGIDAMAALTVLRSRGDTRDWALVSSAGDGKLPPGLMAQIPEGAARYAMHDRDEAGERMAGALTAGGDWTRLSPSPAAGKDWADVTAEARSQQLDQVRIDARRDGPQAQPAKNELCRE